MYKSKDVKKEKKSLCVKPYSLEEMSINKLTINHKYY